MEKTSQIDLLPDRLHAIAVAENCRLSCNTGSILATLSGCPADFCLQAGESCELPVSGLLLVEALGSAARFTLRQVPEKGRLKPFLGAWRKFPRIVFG